MFSSRSVFSSIGCGFCASVMSACVHVGWDGTFATEMRTASIHRYGQYLIFYQVHPHTHFHAVMCAVYLIPHSSINKVSKSLFLRIVVMPLRRCSLVLKSSVDSGACLWKCRPMVGNGMIETKNRNKYYFHTWMHNAVTIFLAWLCPSLFAGLVPQRYSTISHWRLESCDCGRHWMGGDGRRRRVRVNWTWWSGRHGLLW